MELYHESEAFKQFYQIIIKLPSQFMQKTYCPIKISCTVYRIYATVLSFQNAHFLTAVSYVHYVFTRLTLGNIVCNRCSSCLLNVPSCTCQRSFASSFHLDAVPMGQVKSPLSIPGFHFSLTPIFRDESDRDGFWQGRQCVLVVIYCGRRSSEHQNFAAKS